MTKTVKITDIEQQIFNIVNLLSPSTNPSINRIRIILENTYRECYLSYLSYDKSTIYKI